jgi:TRAP transporter TAXI family solute receptor
VGVLAALLCGRPAAASDAAFVARAGKAGGPYYVLVREFAAMLGAKGETVSLEVEESQGSVQNVMDAMRRGPNEFFTAPPGVVQQALRREKPFDANGSYDDIRALFPIPFQTVHWIVRDDAGIRKWEDLRGKSLIVGARGSLAERQTVSLLSVLGLEGQVELLDIDSSGGAEAIRGGKVAGFASSASRARN